MSDLFHRQVMEAESSVRIGSMDRSLLLDRRDSQPVSCQYGRIDLAATWSTRWNR